MERWGPTLLSTVAIIIVITNWTPSTAITRLSATNTNNIVG